ncbi:MAG: hypothetical protein RLY49_542, partial [Candidatus Parcubacteria bacterium]
MVDKIISVIKYILFPPSHLQIFLKEASVLQFESKLTPQPQMSPRMFYPFYYKDIFIKDCIIELKERNNQDVAKRFGEVLARWVVRTIDHILINKNSVIIRLDPRLREDDVVRSGDDILECPNDIHKVGRRSRPTFYLIPIPQHKSKTKEKGFCHTTTLTQSIYSILKNKYKIENIFFYPCIQKEKNIKKLHSGLDKRKRFSYMKYSMKANLKNLYLQNSYFFLIDDVYTSGATFKEARRSLLGCG